MSTPVNQPIPFAQIPNQVQYPSWNYQKVTISGLPQFIQEPHYLNMHVLPIVNNCQVSSTDEILKSVEEYGTKILHKTREKIEELLKNKLSNTGSTTTTTTNLTQPQIISVPTYGNQMFGNVQTPTMTPPIIPTTVGSHKKEVILQSKEKKRKYRYPP
jgi:hypothetical protein